MRKFRSKICRDLTVAHFPHTSALVRNRKANKINYLNELNHCFPEQRTKLCAQEFIQQVEKNVIFIAEGFRNIILKLKVEFRN